MITLTYLPVSSLPLFIRIMSNRVSRLVLYVIRCQARMVQGYHTIKLARYPDI
uniref:Uncharacterized protein n=1 Tax=Arundo donax TaxID=35708 RepID=A0A0A9A6T1_ARUDO